MCGAGGERGDNHRSSLSLPEFRAGHLVFAHLLVLAQVGPQVRLSNYRKTKFEQLFLGDRSLLTAFGLGSGRV